MSISDPIADMLTRIRNANTAKHDTVDIPASKMKQAIADILLKEGYVQAVDVVADGGFNTIRITLKYGADKNEKVIKGLKRISKPGLRVYADVENLPKVLGGLGTAIISTNKGVLTDKEARKENVGGEVLAFIW
ncbi:MAG: 30S ribosomal protein S8 [Eubacterium sp.]|nr:30S ribosomal protein S8 [Eubacterium sp.]MBR1674065.1 30S ribosomal protein S8 [Eubacterium sp.]